RSVDFFAGRDVAARRQQHDAPFAIRRTEDQHFRHEARDVARRKVADADDLRADQLVRAVIGDLRARPFLAERAEVDAHFPRRLASLRERPDLEQTPDAQLDAGEVVIGDGGWGVHAANQALAFFVPAFFALALLVFVLLAFVRAEVAA